MRIEAFRERRLTEGVSLIEIREVDLTLGEVVRHKVTSVRFFWDKEAEKVGVLGRFRLVGGGARSVEGCLLYDSLAELSDCLLRHVERTGSHDLDAALAASGRERASRIRECLGAMMDPSRQGRSLRGQGWRSCHGNLPVLTRSTLDRWIECDDMRRVTIDGSVYLLPVEERLLTIGREFSHPFRGQAVPRRHFVSVNMEDSRRDDSTVLRFTSFDGERVRHASSLRGVPLALREQLDRSGEIVCDDRQGWLSRNDLEPVALVRVPSLAEARPLLEERPVQPTIRGAGLLLFDTRAPVPLPQDGPIVTNVREAYAILSHVRNGIYVSEDAPWMEDDLLQACPRLVTLNRLAY